MLPAIKGSANISENKVTKYQDKAAEKAQAIVMAFILPYSSLNKNKRAFTDKTIK